MAKTGTGINSIRRIVHFFLIANFDFWILTGAGNFHRDADDTEWRQTKQVFEFQPYPQNFFVPVCEGENRPLSFGFLQRSFSDVSMSSPRETNLLQ